MDRALAHDPEKVGRFFGHDHATEQPSAECCLITMRLLPGKAKSTAVAHADNVKYFVSFGSDEIRGQK